MAGSALCLTASRNAERVQSVIHLLQPTTSAIRAISRPSGYPLYSVHQTLYNVHCTIYTVQCTMYTVQCTVYNRHVHCPLCSLYQAAVWSGWLSSPTGSSVRNHIPDQEKLQMPSPAPPWYRSAWLPATISQQFANRRASSGFSLGLEDLRKKVGYFIS